MESRSEDSDEEEPNFHMEVPELVLTAQNETFQSCSTVEPLDIHPEDEHARDLLEALNRPTDDDFTIDFAPHILCSEDIRHQDLKEIHEDEVGSHDIFALE